MSKTIANLSVTLEGSLISFPLAIAATRRTGSSRDGAFFLACATHHTRSGAGLHQRYICDECGETAHAEHELVRCREADDGSVIEATSEEIQAARSGTLPSAELTLAPHPASQVWSNCLIGEKSYRLRPSSKAPAKLRGLYTALREAVIAEPDVVWVGPMRPKSSDRRATFAVSVWQDQLILQELILPADLDPVDVIADEADPRHVEQLRQLATALVDDIDFDVYTWDVRASVAELVAAKAAAGEGTPAPKAEAGVVDIMAALEASVAAAKAAGTKKKAAKRTGKAA